VAPSKNRSIPRAAAERDLIGPLVRSGWAASRRPPIRRHYREIMVLSELLKPPPRRFIPSRRSFPRPSPLLPPPRNCLFLGPSRPFREKCNWPAILVLPVREMPCVHHRVHNVRASSARGWERRAHRACMVVRVCTRFLPSSRPFPFPSSTLGGTHPFPRDFEISVKYRARQRAGGYRGY